MLTMDTVRDNGTSSLGGGDAGRSGGGSRSNYNQAKDRIIARFLSQNAHIQT